MALCQMAGVEILEPMKKKILGGVLIAIPFAVVSYQGAQRFGLTVAIEVAAKFFGLLLCIGLGVCLLISTSDDK